MRRLVVAIDCDDVLIDSTEWIMDEYNRRYGAKVRLEDAFAHDEQRFGVGLAEMFNRFNDLYRLEEFRQLRPREDAVDVVNRLGQNHELHLVTARSLVLELVTLQMLNEYFPGCFKEINHVGEGSKGQVCQMMSADVIIDDNAKHLEDARLCGVGERVWFGVYPWQIHDAGFKNFTERSSDWYSVERAINRIADEKIEAES